MMARRGQVPVVVCAAMLLWVATAAHAGVESAGTRAASFLTQGTSPALLGMGGASLGAARDLNGVTLNLAALGWVEETQIAASHGQLADQTALEWVAVAGRFGNGLTRYGLAAQYRNDGEIVGRDASNRPTEDVTAKSVALSLQLARPFGSHVTMGAAAKYVGEQVGAVRGDGLAFDAGVQLRFGMLGFGLAGQNFGGGMEWGGARWRMPASLGAGVALDHAASGLRLALDVNAPSAYARDVRFGTEWRLVDRVALRAGWRQVLQSESEERLSGPAFGFGVKAGSFWMDYAFQVADADAGTHRVAVQFRPGHARKAVAKDAHPQP